MDDKQIYVAIYYNEKLKLAAYNIGGWRGQEALRMAPTKVDVTQTGFQVYHVAETWSGLRPQP